MPKIKYHAIVEEIYDRVHFRSKVTGSTDMENVLARFLEDLEGDILDHHRDLNDDPEATWEAGLLGILDPTEPRVRLFEGDLRGGSAQSPRIGTLI